MTKPALVRGDVVVCVLAGDYGKPRPAVVIQSDLFNETHASVVVCPVSSQITGLGLFRIPVPASTGSGLRIESEIMVDKMAAVAVGKIRQRIGRLSRAQLRLVDDALRIWLDLPVVVQ